MGTTQFSSEFSGHGQKAVPAADLPVSAIQPAEQLRQAALDLSLLGYSVFPIGDNGEPSLATTERSAILRSWAGDITPNIGLATGAKAGFFAVRVIGQHGDEYIAELEAMHGRLPRTTTIKLPGGIRELLFRWPADRSIPTIPKLPGIPLGVAGEGAYVVAPPSIDAGMTASWEVSPNEMEPAVASDWLLDRIADKSTSSVAANSTASAEPSPLQSGTQQVCVTGTQSGVMPTVADRSAPVSASAKVVSPSYRLDQPDTSVYVGDCRNVLASLPQASVDLVFADPPFNWRIEYGEWDDARPRGEYLQFTREWLDACIHVLKDSGSLWINIPDDSAAEIVMHLKARGLAMVNWCVWHFRFGQCRNTNFIVSKVHALYFAMNHDRRVWNPDAILEPSDRAAIYGDRRTQETNQPGMRVPFDVWYGPNWGRIQGNNAERRPKHQNQLPEVYLERVIRACSNQGQLVLDPFLGSGTTCTVARALGRRSIGIEYSEDYAASAFERIKTGPVRLAERTTESNSFMAHRKRKAKGGSKGTMRKKCS